MDSYGCICSGQTKNDDGPDNTASSLSGSHKAERRGPIGRPNCVSNPIVREFSLWEVGNHKAGQEST